MSLLVLTITKYPGAHNLVKREDSFGFTFGEVLVHGGLAPLLGIPGESIMAGGLRRAKLLTSCPGSKREEEEGLTSTVFQGHCQNDLTSPPR